MITFVLALVCGLALMGALAFVVGLRLPADRVVVREALVAAEIQDVFALIQGVDQYALWRTGVRRIEWLGERETPRWLEHREDGRLSFEVVASEPPTQLVLRQAPPTATFDGQWVFQLAESDGGVGTHLTVTQQGTIPNPMFRTFWRFFVVQGGAVDRWVQDIRAAIAASAGIGAAPAIEVALAMDAETGDSLPNRDL